MYDLKVGIPSLLVNIQRVMAMQSIDATEA